MVGSEIFCRTVMGRPIESRRLLDCKNVEGGSRSQVRKFQAQIDYGYAIRPFWQHDARSELDSCNRGLLGLQHCHAAKQDKKGGRRSTERTV